MEIMKRIRVSEPADCAFCNDENTIEREFIGRDGDVHYRLSVCPELHNRDQVMIRQLSLLTEIRERANLMVALSTMSSRAFVWGLGRIISTTLPSVSMAY